MLSRAVGTSAVARRPLLAAAALYAILALLFVSPALVPGRAFSAADFLWSATPWTAAVPDGVRPLGASYEHADAVEVFEPFLQYSRSRLPEPPLWNPHIGGGRPFVANAQSAVFSPFSWPSFVLPFWLSLGIAASLKLWCCAFGAFLLGRALDMSGPAALLTGIVAAFGLWFVTWLAWPLSSVWAFLPWLLLAIDAGIRRPRAGPVAGLALVVALQFFGGHPESSFHVLVAGALFALLRLSRIPQRRRAVGRLAAGLAAGTALAAVALLPFAELLWHSADLATRGDREATRVSTKYLLALALPEYWGRPTGTVTESFINARAYYAGVLPLLLAVVAVVLRPVRERVAVAATGVVALLVATGVQPLFAIFTNLPGFGQSHNTRLPVLTLLALALLAGWGLDEVRERAPSRRLLAGLALAAVLPVAIVLLRAPVRAGAIGDALAVAWGFATPPPVPEALTVLPMAAALVWIPLAAAALALLRARPLAFTALALAFVTADLFRAGVGQNPAIPTSHARQPVTGAIEALQQRPGRFVGVAERAIVPPLPPDVAIRYGLEDARSYDYPVERRYAELWRREVAPPDPDGLLPAGAVATATPRALRALSLLGVDSVLQPPGDPPPPGLRLVYEGPDARVYANDRALPRAALVGRQTVVGSGRAALDAVTRPGFDPRAEVVVERPLAGVPRSGDGRGAGDARVVVAEPERVRATVDARRPAVLVMPDVHFPGWQARLDGRPVALERVDHLLRGVAVPAGRHEVELRYRPWSWTAGWIVSLLAALGLITAVWKSARRC